MLWRIKGRFKKLWYWLPVIWNDYDFDYAYFWIIMQHKLKSMRNFFNSDYAFGANSKKDAEKMDLCIKVLDRIINEDYLENAHMWHDKKWGGVEKWCNVADRQEQQDIEFLLTKIKKHVKGWWD